MHTPTSEQQEIIDAARDTTDNLIVSALAGAAKTSTLVMVAEALPTTSILCLAFNKRIAEEMTARLPDNCHAMTLNSLGHRTWGQTLSKRLRLEKSKMYGILTEMIGKLPQKEKEEAYDSFSETLKAAEMGKMWGYVPTGRFPAAKPLFNDEEMFAALEIEPTPQQENLIRHATFESIRQALDGTIDFADQIFMPTIFSASFPQYPLVLIDEAQDLSPLNHATLRKLAKKRLIAVGDECQAIYGFRGADGASMANLEQKFEMRKLLLSISFRCPISIVNEAHWRAPRMQWPDWAVPGSVSHLDAWNVEDLPDRATILCRNNAPIFRMAMRLLQDGRYPEIVGNDIGKSLIKTLKKLGSSSLRQEAVFGAIDLWERDLLRKARNKGRVQDQAACLRIFAEQGETLGHAIAYAEHLMTARGPIQLMTGHKSKGLEFDDVYILDRHLVRDKEEQQEANLLYVMQTRSKARLTYIESDFYQSQRGEDE